MEIHITAPCMFILLGFLLFPLQCHSQTLASFSNDTDHQSLLAFRSYVTSDPQRVLQTWNSSVPFCNWRGVGCNVTRQRVMSFDLSYLGLAGTIAPHVGNLSFLRTLRLDGNNFSGNIPQETGNLFELRTLNLSSNGLEGNIPASLGFCSNLVMLDLSSNQLGGRIPSELGNLANLNALVLGDNFLTGSIPPSFSNLTSVRNIILFSNHLTGPIPEGLGHLPLLVNLEVSINHLDGEIPPSIFNRSSLLQLGLAINELSGTLPPDMFTILNNLDSLYIGSNHFSGNIPISLGNASNLVHADFSRNNFTGYIPLLWNLPNIEVLNFESNRLVSDGDNGWDFLTSLANSTRLQVVSLAANMLTGDLPSSVGNLSQQLSVFAIGGNHIEGSLPAEISNLVGLTVLATEYNSFSGEIPSSIADLPILQRLYLDGNIFSGEIPESLGNLTAISEMTLSGNSLSGTIPSSLGNLQQLQVLDLSMNNLTGAIPIEIFNIRNFARLLNLSYNSLESEVPHQIGNLQMIQGIDFSNNRFTGDIPSSIGGCSSLEYLNLSRNSFEGQIPSALSNIRGIRYIDLSSNNLSGEIPVSLDTLSFLQFLDLSMNLLQGSVPLRGIFTNTTAVFLSGNHNLCGGIPEFNLPECNLLPTNRAKRSSAKLIIGLVLGLVGALFLFGALIFLLLRKRCQQQTLTVAGDAFPDEGKYKLYSYYELKSATKDFSSENLVGKGSFGSVYKAVFEDGAIAAVKVFNLDQQEASKSFVTECEALRNVRHRNLMKIISVCSSGDFKALILPLMPNGSLDHWLHKRSELQEEVGSLNLWQRLVIAKEVASAIEYLHHDCEIPIVHCDLKPSNVLLDEDLCAHVTDFGIARILNAPSDHPTSSTLGLKGSIGYIAPEYGVGGSVSTKGDVYSFGILLLEMLTGKRPTNEQLTGNLDLQGWVAKSISNNVDDILDPNLVRNEWDSARSGCMAVAILEIALRCARRSPDERPTMRDVSLLIKNIMTKFSI